MHIHRNQIYSLRTEVPMFLMVAGQCTSQLLETTKFFGRWSCFFIFKTTESCHILSKVWNLLMFPLASSIFSQRTISVIKILRLDKAHWNNKKKIPTLKDFSLNCIFKNHLTTVPRLEFVEKKKKQKAGILSGEYKSSAFVLPLLLIQILYFTVLLWLLWHFFPYWLSIEPCI